MALADYRMATEATLALAKTELVNIVAKLNAIDGHVTGVATDATLALAKTELANIVAKLNALDGHVNTLAKDTTLQASNTALGLLAKDATLLAMANALVDVLSSVKSINGKYGVVILDSGDILISKNTVGSKTVKAVLTELENAVAETPLSFTATAIPDTDADYKIMVTQGTPT